MKIDLQLSDSWAKLNDLYKQNSFVANEPKVSVQVYRGIYHALWEIGQALAQTYPHRRVLLSDQNAGPEIEPINIAFAREGLTNRVLTLEDLKEPSRWLEASQKEALFFVGAFDDPATGELFDYSAVETELKEKRIFRIRISHSYHQFFQLPTPQPYEIYICSFHPDRTVAILGERAQVRPTMAPFLNWPGEGADEIKKQSSFLNLQENKDWQLERHAIQRLEGSFDEANRLLPSGENRIWDRALLIFSDVEGLSLIEQIDEELGVKSQIRTLSLCEWQDATQMQWLMKRGVLADNLRGSLLLPIELLLEKTPEILAPVIRKAHHKLLLRQSGGS
jgi:hypothetical protein